MQIRLPGRRDALDLLVDRARSRLHLCGGPRHHRRQDGAVSARARAGSSASGAKDGGRRPAHRRPGARLQQSVADRGRQHRNIATQAAAEHGTLAPGSGSRDGRRAARDESHSASARLLAQAAVESATGGGQPAGCRHVRDDSADARRIDPGRDRAVAGLAARGNRRQSTRDRAAESRGQCSRRHA